MIFFTIFLVHWFAVASPGQDFFLVVRSALSGQNFWQRLYINLGIGCGVIFWSLLTLGGLGQLIKHFPFLYYLMSIAGACYLIYLAINIILHAKDPLSLSNQKIETASLFRLGLWTNLSNAKAVMYFGGIFASFQILYQNIWIGLAVTGMVFLENVLWFLLIGLVFSRPLFQKIYLRHRVSFEYFSALIFIFFACMIVLMLFF